MFQSNLSEILLYDCFNHVFHLKKLNLSFSVRDIYNLLKIVKYKKNSSTIDYCYCL